MKQLPDIATSAAFWAAVATMWSAAGAWFTYVAAAVDSRQKTYEGVSNLVEGLGTELHLLSEWARGGEGDPGYLKATRGKLIEGHPDWFHPSRMMFTAGTPTLSGVTNSPYAKSMGSVVLPMVLLGHSLRRLFEYARRYQEFVMGDVDTFQAVMKKYSTKQSPLDVAHSATPEAIVVPPPGTIKWEPNEHAYINFIFMMNETIHQLMIGGSDSTDELSLYKAFRNARKALQDFKSGLRREPLPRCIGFCTSSQPDWR